MKIKMMMVAGLVAGTMLLTGCGTEPQAPGPDYDDQNTEEVSYILTEPETEDDGTMTMNIEDENTGDCYGAVCIAYTENGTPYVGGIYTINDEIAKEMIEEGSDPETVKEITKEANNEVWEGIEDDLENLNIAESETIAIEWEQ